jgi:hypothetical protein
MSDIVDSVDGFSGYTYADKIRFFAWYHQARAGVFSEGDIAHAFDELGIARPSAISPFIRAMLVRRPPEVIKRNNGFVLVRELFQEYERRFGRRERVAQVTDSLRTVMKTVTDPLERVYLEETLACYGAKAYRAAVVLAWNAAYDHLLRRILKRSLAEFNIELANRFPKSKIGAISEYDDFSYLRESDVLAIAKFARIISSNLFKLMSSKLDLRNTAAHPSPIKITSLTAEQYIVDVVENIIAAI